MQARLVTADADVLDLAHETLARAWPRLRGWLDDDLEGQRILRHLSTAAESWLAMGRPDAELYRGDRLARAGAWQAASGADLTEHEADFLARSREVADATAAELARVASARRRTRRRASILVAVAACLAIVAGLASWIALRERDQRARERQQADLEQLVSSARRAASLSQSTDDPVESLLLAVEAVRRDDSVDTRGMLLASLTRSPALVRTVPDGGDLVASADGARLFVLRESPRVVDTASFATVAKGDDAFAQFLAEPGLVTWGDGAVYVEAPGAGRLRKIRVPGMHGWSPSGATSDTAGRRIAAGFTRESAEADRYESAVAVWDLHRPTRARLRVTIPGTPDHGGIHDFALAPDGKRLYLVADKHAWLRAYDVGSGDLVGAVPAQLNPARDRGQSSIRVSHDGRALIASDGSDVVLVDTETMDVASRLRGHTARVITMEFSDDDRLVAASALDGSTLVWDRSSGELLERLEGVRLPADSLAFSPDSTTLYASVEGSILVWDLAGSRRFVSTVNEPLGRFGYLVVPAPDGLSSAYFRATVTTFGRDTTFDIVTARGRHRPVAASFANWGAYSPSGDLVATVVDRRLQVWDPLTGHLLRERNVPGIRRAEAVTFTPNGSWIVLGDHNGTVQAVDAATLAPVGEQIAVDQRLVDLVAGADGTDVLVLVGPGDAETFPTYAAVDPATGRVDQSALRGDVQLNFAAVSPDGRRMAVTSGGRAGLIDLRRARWISRLVDADGEIATRVDFNGDGTRFVTSGLEGRAVLWDGLTGERLAAVQPAGPEFETGVVFLPDGHTAQIATSNGQMFRWDTDPAAWVTYACQVAGRNLGAEEWRDLFGSEPYRKTCEEWPSGNES